MKSEIIKLSQLKTNADNPRIITTEMLYKLVNSILVFPKMLGIRPIAVDFTGNDGHGTCVSLGGNQRTSALYIIKGMQLSDIESRLQAMPRYQQKAISKQNALVDYWREWLNDPYVEVVDISILDDDEKEEFVIKDNVPFGQWDFDMLANKYDKDLLEDWGVDLMIDFSDQEGGTELDKVNNDEFTEEEQEKAKEANRTNPGDIWQLGRHRLMCGDSTKADDVRKLMNGQEADLWITDPPYNVAYEGGTKDKLRIENDNMNGVQFGMFLTAAFQASEAVMKKGCPFYVWFASREHINFEQALKNARLEVREELIWAKNSLVLGRQDYQWKHEPCLYGWKEGAAHYFINSRSETTVIQDETEIDIDKMSKADMKVLLHRIYDEKTATTVIYENKPTKSEDHPTMKPVRLFAYQIANSSKKGDIILDTFGGSGTTMVACEQMDRSARLMEIDPHYADVIVARWEKLTGKTAYKVNQQSEE